MIIAGTPRLLPAVLSGTAGLIVAVGLATPALADPAPVTPGPTAPGPVSRVVAAPVVTAPIVTAPADAGTVPAAQGAPVAPVEGVPHLASPDALPPGSTMDPAAKDPDSPNVSYLKDLWQAVQNHEISGKEALIMGLAQRGMNTPYPQQAAGPNVPVTPGAAPPPADVPPPGAPLPAAPPPAAAPAP